MAEIELSQLSRQCLNRRIADKNTFIHEIAEWNKNRDAEQATIDWQFTTEDARIKLKRLYPVLQLTGQIQCNVVLGYCLFCKKKLVISKAIRTLKLVHQIT